MIHDFAQLHNRNTEPTSKAPKIKSVLVVAGLLFVAVGAKHLVDRAEVQMTPAVSQSELAVEKSSKSVDPVNTADQPKKSAKLTGNKKAATEAPAFVDQAIDSSPSLLKKIVGEANGAGFEFYDMLKHAWPKANEMMIELKESPMPDQAAFLQVASFHEVDEAEKLRKKLSAMGMDATVETGGSDSGTRWFRVFVGPFSSEAKLKKTESALTKMSFSPVPTNR